MTEVIFNKMKEQGEATQTAAERLICDNVGPCPKCGSVVAQYSGHFACSQSLSGGCSFTIATADIEASVTATVTDVLLDAIIGGNAEVRQLMSDLLDAPEKQKVAWYNSDDCICEYEMQLAKNDAGQWVVLITCDDGELDAFASEGLVE